MVKVRRKTPIRRRNFMKRFAKVFVSAILLVVTAFTFAACVPSSYDKAVSKMQDAGYTVAGSTYDKDTGAVGSFAATKVSLSNIGNSNAIIATLYSSSKEAKAAYDKLKSEDNKENLKQKGKWVYFGSSEAIKAFEK